MTSLLFPLFTFWVGTLYYGGFLRLIKQILYSPLPLHWEVMKLICFMLSLIRLVMRRVYKRGKKNDWKRILEGRLEQNWIYVFLPHGQFKGMPRSDIDQNPEQARLALGKSLGKRITVTTTWSMAMPYRGPWRHSKWTSSWISLQVVQINYLILTEYELILNSCLSPNS